MSVNKEKLLNQHVDDLQKQIYLLEIDQIILEQGIKQSNNKEEIDFFQAQLNGNDKQPGLRLRIKGIEQRIQIIMKVVNGTIKMDDNSTQDKPTHTIQE